MDAGTQSIAVSAKELTKRFPGVVALDAVDFDVRAGEVHALVGENGAGKSTLIKLITGVDQPDSGHIALFGALADGENAAERRAGGVTAIYQELTIVPAMSATANVFLGHPIHKALLLQRGAMRRAFLELCARLGVTIDPNRPCGELSISEQQMIEIMRALVAQHRVLVMDEPTAALGPKDRAKLFEVISELRKQGTAIIYISHDLDEVLRVADRISVMRNGHLVGTGDKSEWTKEGMVRAMLGRSARPRPEVRVLVSDELALAAEAVSVPGRVSNVSFELRKGEILGIAGLVGSGRTELLRAIAGADPKASGSIVVDGKVRSLPRSIREALALGICLVPEDRKAQGFIPLLSGARNVVLTDLARVSSLGFVRADTAEELAAATTTPLGFDKRRLPDAVRTLSGGNQQKLVVGKWLHRRPRVLLLDEPTRGIDIGAKAELYGAVRQLADEGLSVILVSSELEEVLEQSDRVAILNRGTLVATLDRENATMNRVLGSIFSLEGPA
jgi:ABC-type sugar transport system ATPase subunit